MPESTVTFSQAIRRRLLRNKGALFGLVLIGLALLVAVFGYFLAPDPSPYANRIILEVGGNKPGYRQAFLLQRKAPAPSQPGFFGRLLHGTPDPWERIPVTAWQRAGDSLVAQVYIDEGLTDRRSYAINTLAPDPVEVRTFRLGTDKYGRDILSRLLIGTRVSLTVGLVTVLISLSIGIFLG
ncbi:MAG: ABC transporter permease, partial [Chitinophagaceae bacterium]